ncbi:MAG: rhodanese-like domain-containing protein [Dehalococcoidia bacterium]|jgi:rhodanese-related sulfurtransferase|nr:rhodanese-like domain-containing protein [Dehalococcoidia bacterium]
MAEQRPGEPFKRVDVHEAKEMIDAGNVQVIDAREPWEHAEGHVPGSLRIQHMAVLVQADKLARDRPILFICKSGARSAVAAEFAASLGITDLYNVDGGHEAWAAAGYPMDLGD